MRKFSAVLSAYAHDAAGIIGAVVMVRGAWLIYQPAGYIVAGVLLIGASLLLARGDD